MILPQFGARLRAKRMLRGLSRKTLSEIFHVSTQSIYRWETGVNLPEGRYVNLLIGELGFHKDELEELYESFIIYKATPHPTYDIRGYKFVENNFRDWNDFLEHLIQIDVENIPHLKSQLEGTAPFWAPIFRDTPYAWKVVIFNGKVVGYWHFIPLQDAAFERIKSGSLNEIDISDQDIAYIDDPGRYNMYISMIGIEKSHRGPQSFVPLKRSFVDAMIDLGKVGVFFDHICAHASTKQGIRLCESIGLESNGHVNAIDGPVHAGSNYDLCSSISLSTDRRFNSIYESEK